MMPLLDIPVKHWLTVSLETLWLITSPSKPSCLFPLDSNKLLDTCGMATPVGLIAPLKLFSGASITIGMILPTYLRVIQVIFSFLHLKYSSLGGCCTLGTLWRKLQLSSLHSMIRGTKSVNMPRTISQPWQQEFMIQIVHL